MYDISVYLKSTNSKQCQIIELHYTNSSYKEAKHTQTYSGLGHLQNL